MISGRDDSSIDEDSSLLIVEGDDSSSIVNMSGDNDVNGKKSRASTDKMNGIFSDESTQAVYEEIEVQHQSHDGWENRAHGGGDAEHSPIKNGTIHIHHKPPRHINAKGRGKFNIDEFNGSSRYSNVGSPGKSSIDSSQDQSASSWFPIPILTAVPSKSNQHKQIRASSPMSSQDMPFDEKKKKPQHDILNLPDEQLSPSGINQQHRIETRTHRQDRPWRTDSNLEFSPKNNGHKRADPQSFVPSKNYSREINPSSNSTESNSLLESESTKNNHDAFTSNSSEEPKKSHSRSPQHYRNPFSSNSSEAPQQSHSRSPQHYRNPLFSSSSSEAAQHSQPLPVYRNPFSSSGSEAAQESKPPPVYRNPFSSDSEKTNDVQSSPRKYRNPFSSTSSNSTFIEQSLSLQSMKSQHDDIPQFHGYKNPFDSGSTSAEDMSKNLYRGRKVSKSPERERIRPTTSLMTNESKLHSLLSCATSPSDPKWMEALQLLANAPNPTQLAMMKVSLDHEWTALHIAALSNPPLYVIYGLLLVYPEAVRQMDAGGRLPIHLAAGSEASVSVLSILVRFYHESVIIKEGRGLVPLHLALLRDGGEEMSADIVRVLLGQNLNATRGQGGMRKVKDGALRRGEHLNLKLSDVKSGMFGENPNTISMKERRKREIRIKNMSPQNIESYSRGFGSDIHEVDSTDGIPYKHEYLTSLWDEEGIMDVDIFGNIELIELQKFSFEVQNCLRKLSKIRKKRKEGEHKSHSNKKSENSMSPAYILAPKMRLPIHMAIKRNYTVPDSCRLPTDKQNDVLRILINANPASLMHQDNLGKTPLMTCLELAGNDSIYPVDLEMVELLLGFRTRDFHASPEWLEDNDIVESQQTLCKRRNENSFIGCSAYNPAMVPYGDMVPLHVAVSKSLPSPIIFAIFSFFPGAKYIQDERKCTPLHYALQHSSNNVDLDMSLLCLLIDKRIVAARDILNVTAFDLLVENCKNGRISNHDISSQNKCLEDFPDNDMKSKLQVLFQHSFQDEDFSKDHNSRYSNLEDLRYLPSWIRTLAFETPAVQKALITKISSPFSTALIVINAIVLFMLIVFYMNSVDVVLTQGYVIPSGFIGIVTTSSVFLALYGLYNAYIAFRLQIGWKCCVCNIWSWVTLIGLVLSFTTVIQFTRLETNSSSIVGDSFVTLIITTIGFLWAMLVGFACRWCYGVSILYLSILKVCSLLRYCNYDEFVELDSY